MKKKKELSTFFTKQQSEETTLGRIAEEANFLKDRQDLSDRISRSMQDSAAPEYHQKLLSLDPQNYAELSAIQWLYNSNRLRGQKELAELEQAVRYMPKTKKRRPIGFCFILTFFLMVYINLIVIGVKGADGYGGTEALVYPLFVVRCIAKPWFPEEPMPSSLFENQQKVIHDYWRYDPNKFDENSVKDNWIIRLSALLALPQTIVEFFKSALIVMPAIGFLASFADGIFFFIPTILSSACASFFLYRVSVRLFKPNFHSEELIQQFKNWNLNFETGTIKNVYQPFLGLPEDAGIKISDKRFKATPLAILSLLFDLMLAPIAIALMTFWFWWL